MSRLLNIPTGGLVLQDDKSSKSLPAVTVIGLTLDDELIGNIIQSIQFKKQPVQLSLGPNPELVFTNVIHKLTPHYDPFTHEIYDSEYSKNPQKTKAMPVANKIGHSAVLFKASRAPIVRTVSPGQMVAQPKNTSQDITDSPAHQLLKAQVDEENIKRAAKATKLVKDSDVQKMKKPQGKNKFLGSFSGSTRGSLPSSPSMTAVASPRQAPTSAPQSIAEKQAEKLKSIRNPIIHALAIAPASKEHLYRLKSNDWTDHEFQTNIEKVADKSGEQYVLRQKSYQQLDVFRYIDDAGDRQKAIDNAVKAFDKARLDLSAPEWERLLPKEERGTGKCLSKLQSKIASGTARAPKISVHRPDGIESGVEDSGREGCSIKGERMGRSGSGMGAKSKQMSDSAAQAKRQMGDGRISKPSTKQAAPKPAAKKEKLIPKAAEKFKSAQFISDSDEDDDDSAIASQSSPEKILTKKMKPALDGKAAAKRNLPSSAPQRRLNSPANLSTRNDSPTKDVSPLKRTASEMPIKNGDAVASLIRKNIPKTAQPPESSRTAPKAPLARRETVQPSKRKSSDDEPTDVQPAKKMKPAQALHRASTASTTSRGTASSLTSNYSGIGRPRSGTQKSSPLASSPPTNASDHDEVEQGGYTSGSSTSKDSAGKSREQPQHVIDLARLFKSQYQAYQKEYKRLEGSSKPDPEELKKLLQTHERLSAWKSEICADHAR